MSLTNLEPEDIGRLFIEICLIELLIQQLYFISPHFSLFIFLFSSWLYFIIVFLAIIYSFHYPFYSFLFCFDCILSLFSILFNKPESPWLNLCNKCFLCTGMQARSWKRRGEQNQITHIVGCSVQVIQVIYNLGIHLDEWTLVCPKLLEVAYSLRKPQTGSFPSRMSSSSFRLLYTGDDTGYQSGFSTTCIFYVTPKIYKFNIAINVFSTMLLKKLFAKQIKALNIFSIS